MSKKIQKTLPSNLVFVGIYNLLLMGVFEE